MEDKKDFRPNSLEFRLKKELVEKVDGLFKHDGVAIDIPGWGKCKVGNYQVMGIWKIKDISDSLLRMIQDEKNPSLVINRKDSGTEVVMSLGFIDETEGPSEVRLDLKRNQPALLEIVRKLDQGIRDVRSREANLPEINDFLLILNSSVLMYRGNLPARIDQL